MLQNDANALGFDLCNGKQTIRGYDSYSAAKYCYVKTRAAPKTAPARSQSGLPDGWYAYHSTARAPTNENTMVTFDSTIRYDISTETYKGQGATRIKMNMKTVSSEGSGSIYTDIYTIPVSYAILGGTAAATMGDQTKEW